MVLRGFKILLANMGRHHKEIKMELNNRAWKNWKKGHKLQKQFWYAYYYKHSLIQEKTIMYQAYRNNIMGGNPYGIF